MKILFFARDPGGTNILAKLYPLVKQEKAFVAKDHARAILTRHGIEHIDFNTQFENKNLNSDDALVVKNFLEQFEAQVVITGTSHFDDYTDRLIWNVAPSLNKTSIAVLDQWHYVDERFDDGQNTYRPHHILSLSEELAKQIAQKKYALNQVFCLGHPHLSDLWHRRSQILKTRDHIREKIKKQFKIDFDHLILYASEPNDQTCVIENHSDDLHHDAISCFQILKKAFDEAAIKKTALTIKAHPKEDLSFYHQLHPYVIDHELSSEMCLAAADQIVGINSMFLIEGVVLGKSVISFEKYAQGKTQLITNKLKLSQNIASQEDLVKLLKLDPAIKSRDDGIPAKELSLNSSWQEEFIRIMNQVTAVKSAV